MTNDSLIALAEEGRRMRERHRRQQRTEDAVMKLLFVAMCPLLFPILFVKD